MPIITDAILNINSSAQVVVRGSDLDTCEIEWMEGTSEISKADIQTKMNELQAEYDSLAYARKRQLEYPSLNDFAEAYTEKEFGGDATKMDAYKIKYEKVRSDNPK
jgi:hypothetical protein